MAITFPHILQSNDVLMNNQENSVAVRPANKNVVAMVKESKSDKFSRIMSLEHILLGALALILVSSFYVVPASMMASSLKDKIMAQITTNADFNKGYVDLNSAYTDLDMRAIGEVKICAINAAKKARINAFNLWTYRNIAVQQHVSFLEHDCSEYLK